MLAALLAGFARLVTGATASWLVEPQTARRRVYFANHSSHADFVTIWAALPPDLRIRTRPVAAVDYWRGGAVRRHVGEKVFRAVLIERDGGREAALELMTAALAAGDSLIIFPEGTRGDGLQVAPFRSGLYNLARADPEAELVPVRLQNLNRVLPKGASIPVPVIARLTFGAPLALAPAETREAFLERARDAVVALDVVPA